MLLRPILFSGLNTDPEWLHQQSFRLLQWLDRPSPNLITQRIRTQLQHTCCLTDPRLEQTLWGIPFPNPVGLAAGFDKDGIASGIWATFGFGFAELGTVTYHAQPGNPKPRLFRLLPDRAVLNRMGFNNQGAAVMAATLEQRWGAMELESKGVGSGEWGVGGDRETLNAKRQTLPLPLGINLGKSKVTPLEDAAADYVSSFKLLKDWGDYFVVNVSSPNTPGLRSLQDKAQLSPILQALQQENTDRKPLLVKIAPDLEWDAIADVIDLAQQHQLAGIIATNTTIRRDGLKTQMIQTTGNPVSQEAGGISGAPVRERSTEVIRFIYKETQGALPIIGVGGIFTAADAWEKITAGASLVQTYTGWIYEGPLMLRYVLQGLLERLDQYGFQSMQEAIGTGA